MHHLSSKQSVWRFRFAAWLLCAKCLLTPLVAGFLVYSLIFLNHQWVIIALASVFATVLLVILQWIVAARTHCPLCITPVLASKRCNKHRHARRALGSHRLRVALGIVFKKSFRCPYCNEPTVLQVRDRHEKR